MDKLEWTKSGFKFENMCNTEEQYCDPEFMPNFPKGITFKDQENYKDIIFALGPYTETKPQAYERGAQLIEEMNQRIHDESASGKGSVCYILVSHSIFVDETSHIFSHL